jgi:demethylmenaquinone methyltransferase/2-methoxy-6-polyprenyl-1,4-benzoquinol methylase
LESTLDIYHQYPDADIVAVDFSSKMLEHGRNKLDAAALRRITLKATAAEHTGEADASLDAIFCAFGLRNIADIDRVTDEQARCLKAGGQLTVLEFFRPTSKMSKAFIALYGRTLFPIVGRIASGDPEAYRYLRRSIEAFLALQSYCDLLVKRGFENVRAVTLAPGIASVVRATRALSTVGC